jgi:hypothetical protein
MDFEQLPDGFLPDRADLMLGFGGRRRERWRKFVASQADLQPRWQGRFRHSIDGTRRGCTAPFVHRRFIENSSTINTPCKRNSHAVNDERLCFARPQFFAHKE